MDDGRLIVDRPARGSWNMAVDEALLRETNRTGRPTLRFYSWSEPTLSLGYFQPLAARQDHPPSCGCTAVRRSTGGGAILHDRELTYSMCMPVSLSNRAIDRWLCEQFHESLVDVLHTFGVRASLCREMVGRLPQDEPFLCFQRRAIGDVLINGHKIAGSAQRRYQRAVMQQGSVLLRESAHAPDVPGIYDASSVDINTLELVHMWVNHVQARLTTAFVVSNLTTGEMAATDSWEALRFANPVWTHKR